MAVSKWKVDTEEWRRREMSVYLNDYTHARAHEIH